MFDKLEQAEKRYEEMQTELAKPDVASDIEKYRRLMKEEKNLSPLIEEYRRYKRTEKDIAETESLLGEKLDPSMREMAEQELKDCRQRLEESSERLKLLLLPKDENDDKNVIIEIRGGAGGDEAALFAYVLYRMYNMYAERRKFKTELLNVNETGLGGFKEVSFSVEGNGAYSRLKFESGVHRVQRVPETESQGRIHTSTVTVAVLPEAEEVEIGIDPGDLKIDTIKSSGAGGQHINKTESAIRLTHIPTGIVIECQDERSQFKNRDKAMKLLRTKLYDMKAAEQHEKISSQRKSQVGTGDRSEKIRTYNYPQGRVTDHRIGLSLYSLENFLNGDMDQMIDALATADAAEKIKAQSEA
ncbi:MAG: peptide chain release factor 1 [Clostridia bacterium]|nr:peptide chain release factor 1 [Clostridia bacterium]